MNKPTFLAAALAALTSLGFVAEAGAGKKHPPPTSPPRISLETARATALRQVPGTIIEEELETKKGAWVYEFEIRPSSGGGGGDGKAAVVKEVEIDGNTGVVLKVEDDHDD